MSAEPAVSCRSGGCGVSDQSGARVLGIRVGAASSESVHIACDAAFPDGLHEVTGSLGAGCKPTFSFGLTGHYNGYAPNSSEPAANE